MADTTTTAAQASTDERKVLEVTRPAAGETRVYGEEYAQGSDVQMRFDLKDTTQLDAVAEGDNLVINFKDGGKVELQDFYKKFSKEQQLLGEDGEEELSAYLEALVDKPIETALGPAPSPLNGARYTDYDNLDLLDGVNHLRELDWGMPQEVQYDEPRVTQGVDDNGGYAAVVAAPPVAPQPELQSESQQPESESAPAPAQLITSPFVTYDQALTGDDQWAGSYNFYIRDLPEGYTLGEGADAALAALNAAQSTGTFEWVTNEAGEVTGLKFTQTEAYAHDRSQMQTGTVGWTDDPDERFPAIDAAEHQGDAKYTIEYNVLPLSGGSLPLVNSATGARADWVPEVRIVDDKPVANDDFDRVDEGDTTSGNLLHFGDDRNPEADKYSHDGGKEGTIVTKVAFENAEYDVPAPVQGEGGLEYPSITIEGQYGTLTVSANGDYEYTSTKDIDADVSDVFTYTITDSDGSSAMADLTIDLSYAIDEAPVPDEPQTPPDTSADDAVAVSPEVIPDVEEGDNTNIIGGDSGSQPAENVQNIGLVVDTSSSMWTQLSDGTTRFDATMDTLRGMIKDMAGKVTDDPSLTVNISLVEFSDVAQLHTFGEGGAWLTMNAGNASDMVELFNATLDDITAQFTFDGFPGAYNKYGEIPLETVKDAINDHFGFEDGSDDYLHISREAYLDVVSANQWTARDEFNLVDHQTNYQVAFDEALEAFSNPPAIDGAEPSNSLFFMSDGSPNRFVPANAGGENGADLGIEDWGIFAMLDGGYDGLIQDPGTNATLYREEPFPSIEDSIARLEGIYGKAFEPDQRELVQGKLEQFRDAFTRARAEGGAAFAEFEFVDGIKDNLESFIAANPAVYSPSYGELVSMGVSVEAVAWAGNDADFNLDILNAFAGGEATLIDSEEGLGDFLDAEEMLKPDDGAGIINGSAGDDIINGGDDNDAIFGQGGDDVINGDGGNDFLNGGDGADQLNGGEGDDIMVYDAADVIEGGSGIDVLLVAGESDVSNLFGSEKVDGVEVIISGAEDALKDLTSMDALKDLGINLNGEGAPSFGEGWQEEVNGDISTWTNANSDVTVTVDNSAMQEAVEQAARQIISDNQG